MAASGEGEDDLVPEAGWDTESLGESASDSIFEYRDYARSGREAAPEALAALARAGLLVSLARPRLPDPAAWSAFLKRHDISRLEASDALAASVSRTPLSGSLARCSPVPKTWSEVDGTVGRLTPTAGFLR